MATIYANTIEPIPEDAAERACIEQFDGKGNLVVRTFGPTMQEQYEAHLAGTCDMMCSYCWEEAMKTVCQECGYPLDETGSCPNGMCEDY